ncbi:MAG: hypothetical protein ACREBV_03285 [Candidatus Zixiibacteriota bacterium]
MAQIYMECERYDDAFEELEYLFSLESEFSVNELKFMKEFDPIRDHPRYKELLKKYGASDGN